MLYAVTLPKKRHYSRFLSFRRSCHLILLCRLKSKFTSDYLLKILGHASPICENSSQIWSRTAVGTTTMILKPSSAGGVAVGHLPVYTCSQCWLLSGSARNSCVHVCCGANLTMDFAPLVALAKSCNGMNISNPFLLLFNVVIVSSLAASSSPITPRKWPSWSQKLSILIFLCLFSPSIATLTGSGLKWWCVAPTPKSLQPD